MSNFLRALCSLLLLSGCVFYELLPQTVRAQNLAASQTPESRQQIRLSFAPLVKETAPAVVNIYTRKVVRQTMFSPFFNDPVFQHFFGGQAPEGWSRDRIQNALGSGVIVAADGLIVTSRHVIADADEITVALSDKREFPAKVVMNDERTDLALLKIDIKGEALPHIDLMDSDQLEVGDLVLAIGNPFGVGQTVTMGIVSATARTDVGISDSDFFIQTDAAINPGNSGGALVTMDGRLAGINAAIYSRDGGSLGIGFAVPSSMVKRVIDAYHSGGKLVRPWSGIETQDITAELAQSLGLAKPAGALVSKIASASPARQAGLKAGDVIVALDGKDIDSPQAFAFRLGTLAVGGEAKLTVARDGKTLDISMPLIAPPENPPRQETRLSGRSPLEGATVANLSPAVADELSMQAQDLHGVVILKIEPGSTAAGFGFQRGDIILGINSEKIDMVDSLKAALETESGGWRLSIKRGDEVMSLAINR